MYYGAKICFSLHISFIGDILLLNLTYREILVLLVLLHLGRPDMHMRHDGHGVRRGGGGVSAYIVRPRRKGAYGLVIFLYKHLAIRRLFCTEGRMAAELGRNVIVR